MDGDPEDSHTDPIEPIDPKLEALLRQELATPRESEERIMTGLTLELKLASPRAPKVTRLETGSRRHLLAAAVMLVLAVGLFALMALSKTPVPVNPDRPEKSAVATPNEKKKNCKGDGHSPKQAEPLPPVDPQIAALVLEIEEDKIPAREVLAARLVDAGVAGSEAMARELKVLANTHAEPNKIKRINDALALFQQEQDKQFNAVCDALGDQVREPHAPSDLETRFKQTGNNAVGIPLGKNAFYLAPEPKLLEILNRRVTFQFADQDLSDALRFLAQVAKIKAEIDPKATVHVNSITLNVSDMPLGQALDWIAKLANLETVKRGSMIIVTTPERAARFSLQQMAFKLPVAPGAPAWTLEETKEICALLAPGIAEPAAEGIFTAFASERELAKIEQQLQQIGGDAPKPAQWMVDTDQKLAHRVKFQLVNETFDSSCWYLNYFTKVNIVVDPKLSADVALKTPVSLTVDDLPAGEALTLLLQQCKLAADYRSNVLFITQRPLPLETTLCTFDFQPAIKAGAAADKLQALLDTLAAEAPFVVAPPPSRMIHSLCCARIDAWTAQRMVTVLTEAAKTGVIPQPPHAPWIFKVMKNVAPAVPHSDNLKPTEKATPPSTSPVRRQKAE